MRPSPRAPRTATTRVGGGSPLWTSAATPCTGTHSARPRRCARTTACRRPRSGRQSAAQRAARRYGVSPTTTTPSLTNRTSRRTGRPMARARCQTPRWRAASRPRSARTRGWTRPRPSTCAKSGSRGSTRRARAPTHRHTRTRPELRPPMGPRARCTLCSKSRRRTSAAPHLALHTRTRCPQRRVARAPSSRRARARATCRWLWTRASSSTWTRRRSRRGMTRLWRPPSASVKPGART
mmetsp:Transcript_3010/g.7938  ORF Transcript_3010/g.7938 Transcript_3010/m.7938 type:complete len:238 (-) Transcript_3010:138-851(-)